MKVRIATETDIEVIAKFNQAMALETENKHLPDPVIVPGVTKMVNDADTGFYLVAEQDDEILGSLGITFEWSDWRNGLFWWIQSVFVAPSARRQGVFQALYSHVNQLAKAEDNVCGLRLYVEKENANALQTYLSLGMHETHYRMIEVEFGAG